MAKRKPRVTIVGLNYIPEPTGIAPYTSGLAAGLVGKGWSVRAITAFPHYPAWKITDGYSGRVIRESRDGVDVIRLRPFIPKVLSGVKRALFELFFGVSASCRSWGSPDVVVLVSPALFATAIALIRARFSPKRPPVVIWVQDLYSLGVAETGALGARGARVMTALEGAVLRRANSVVVIHDRFRRHVESTLRVPSHKVSVVRNWTHLRPILVDRAEHRKKLGWADETVVLHAGNMGAKQALENVVDAARLADSRGDKVRFVLLGNGNQRRSLEALGQGVARLQFIDSLDDEHFQGAMAAADILLVNEKSGVAEMAVPSKLTSYFAAGRPVIVATDLGSITSEEVEAAGAGMRVDAEDPIALLDAALSLGADGDSAERYGAAGTAYQRRILSQPHAISHYADIITGLAGKRSR